MQGASTPAVIMGFSQSSTGAFGRKNRDRSEARRGHSVARVKVARAGLRILRGKAHKIRGAKRDKAVGRTAWPEARSESAADIAEVVPSARVRVSAISELLTQGLHKSINWQLTAEERVKEAMKRSGASARYGSRLRARRS